MNPLLQEIQPYLEVLFGVSVAVYVFLVAWFAAGTRPFCPGGGGTPLVSVVVAARDEAAHIGHSLDDLLAQTYPAEACEIIVVDDGSTDATAAIVHQRVAAGQPVRLLSTREACGRSGSKKAALTLGIGQARGELILTTDADCRLPPTWVRGMVDCFGADIGMVVGFSQIGRPAQGRGVRWGWEAVDFLCLMASAWGSAGQGHPMGASGQNLAYRRQAFLEVGGYERVKHRASGDDLLLLQLIRRLTRWRIVFSTSSETFATHPASLSWGALFSQRCRWASNAPFQIYLDPLFFAYLAGTFTVNLLLVLSPILVLGGGLEWRWAGMGWAAKILVEFVLFYRTSGFFGRRDLRRYFPLWALTQPLYTVLVGGWGCLGRFSWKGKHYRWGENR